MNNETKNYTVYHLHTELSLLDSCTNFKLYVDKAVELGQRAIAFTEHGNIYNWIEKKMYCNEKGLKYIHGVECYLTESLEEKVRDNYHTILLAKNHDGVKEINMLMDIASREDHFYYKPRLTFEEFFNITDNVIKISACLASPLAQYPSSTDEVFKKIKEVEEWSNNEILRINNISQEEYMNKYYINQEQSYPKVEWWQRDEVKKIKDKLNKKVNDLKSQINNAKSNYERLLKTYDYYEIQPHVKSLDQIKYNKMLYEASKRYGKPLIAGTDTHNINQYKAECRSILQKAKRIMYSSEDEFDLTYKSYDEVVEMFRQQNSLPMDVVLDALENTNRMADMVEDFELDTSFKYPKLYDDEEEALKNRIVKMLKEKIDKGIIDKSRINEYKANIAEELKVFKKIDMVGFILFMSELVCWCWDNDIPIGYCRGSVGGSTIAYITDIIDVDPVVWKTVFSRFANEDRKEIGDIDIDISPSQRHLVYEHIIKSFGLDKTAYILAIGTISDKGTIDEIGRALDIPLDDVAKIKNEYENDPEATKKKYPNVFYYFDGLLGTAISQSMHPAGIIVAPMTLTDNYGTFWSEDKRILYINMEECHEISLVKYDLLG